MNNNTATKILNEYELHCQQVLKSTKVDNKETPTEKRKRIKSLEKDYVVWFEYYLSHYAKSKCSWYQKKVAKLLINNPIIFVVLRVFRGGAKSTHTNIGIPLYLYFVKKDLKFMLLIGDNLDKAQKLISKIQAELQFNQKLSNDYGKRFKVGNWADGKFNTTDGTLFYSLGIGQSPRGLSEMEDRPDYIAVDDVDTKKRSKNPKLVKELFEYLKEDVMGAFGKEKRRYVQANNRFSMNSCIQLMSEHFNSAITECKRASLPIVHKIIIAKAINDKGESGWPEYYSIADWRAIQIEKGTVSFEREYQDNPIEEGRVFKNEWMHKKQRLALHQYEALSLYGDLSYKDAGDFKALLLVGKIGREFHIIKAFVRRTSRTNAAVWMYDLYEEMNLKKYNIRYKIEGLFAMDEFVSDFDTEGDKRGYYIPVTADKRPKANKQERIEGMSPFFERGNVFMNSVEADTNDFKELEAQLLGFEKGSSINDDAPDALQGAISDLNGARPLTAKNTRIKSRSELTSKRKNRF